LFEKTAVFRQFPLWSNKINMSKNIQIPAIHDKDLRKVLDKYQISSKIDNHELLCYNCMNNITWDNLYAMKVKDNNLVFFCDKIDCIENSTN